MEQKIEILQSTKFEAPKNFVVVGFPSLDELKKAIRILGVSPLVVFHAVGVSGWLPGTIKKGKEIYYAYKDKEIFYYLKD